MTTQKKSLEEVIAADTELQQFIGFLGSFKRIPIEQMRAMAEEMPIKESKGAKQD